MEKQNLSQKTIDDLIVKLADKIKNSNKKYTYIVGIARGGLHISKPLAKMLKIKHMTIKISFYNPKFHNAIPYPRLVDVRKFEKNFSSNDEYLFVDDLIDAGHTMNWINENLNPMYGPFDTAVLYLRKKNKYNIIPTFYVEEKPKGWIVFPWEQALTLENKA